MINYKWIAMQFGESIKYDSSLNEINRTFLSLTNLTFNEYPNTAITSSRSQTTYSWIMTIGNSKIAEDTKIDLMKSAIEALVLNEKSKLRLLALLPRVTLSQKPKVLKSGGWNYVNENRIQELRDIKSATFDFSKLIRLCEELNVAFDKKSYLSVTMLVRSIIDHVPPVFGYKNFTEVANNYGTKSYKDSMLHLNNSLKKIADAYLHVQIKKRESLPNSTQVDFSNALDLLLSELVRIS